MVTGWTGDAGSIVTQPQVRHNLRRIAWTPALRAYFNTNFVKVLADRQGDTLYVRRGLRPR